MEERIYSVTMTEEELRLFSKYLEQREYAINRRFGTSLSRLGTSSITSQHSYATDRLKNAKLSLKPNSTVVVPRSAASGK